MEPKALAGRMGPSRWMLQAFLLASVGVVEGCDLGYGPSGCGRSPGALTVGPCTSVAFVPKTCSELNPSRFFWNLNGFHEEDILNSDVRQTELTAIMRVGEVKVLKVKAATTDTSEDCSGKATSVEWSTTNPGVARLDVAETRTASLVALQPGDTVVSALLKFQDAPPLRIVPWSFTRASSGDITIVRVVP